MSYEVINEELEQKINRVIQGIIENRKKKVGELRSYRENFADIQENMVMLKERWNYVYANQELYRQLLISNPGLLQLLENQQLFDECISAYKAAIEELDHLISRFSRESVNISVAGDSRAGKSRFLQTVTGLDNNCIPSFPGKCCTGVSSIIENDNNIPEGAVRCVFTFKTEKEILREINDKLDLITKGGLNVYSLDEVKKLTKNELLNKLRNDAEKGRINEVLEMYVEHYDEWSTFITLSLSDNALKEEYQLTLHNREKREYICTEKSEIQKFVAKHDGHGLGGIDANRMYRFIAVKNAIIYAKFDLTDVNKIRLVDTVGLGDIEVGTKEKMYEAIDQNSDAVLYFFKPDSNKGGRLDDRLYHILNHELYNRYKKDNMKWWMAVVVNHDAERTGNIDNLGECQEFLREFSNYAPDMNDNIVFKTIIDVSKKMR